MRTPVQIPPHNLGVVPITDPEATPLGALIAAENWIWQDGELRVRPGVMALGSSVAQRPTTYIQYKHSDGNTRIVKATVAGWWKYVSGAWTDISGTALTGGPADLTVFRVFQKAGATHLLGTNGADVMKKWDGSVATYSNVGGTPPRARAMMVLFDRVIVGNLLSGGTVSPLAVDVSAFQDFDSGWGTVFVGLVGIETPGNIVAMLEAGSLVGAIYKDDAVVLAIAQSGASSPFRFETKVTNVPGPASAACVIAPSDGLHLIFGNNCSIMRFDTVSYQPLGGVEGRKFQAHIEKTANISTLGRSFAMYDSLKNNAWFFYAEKGNIDPQIGIVINLNNFSMWPFRLPWAVSAAGFVNSSTGLTIGDLTIPIGSISQTIGELATANSVTRGLIGRITGQTYEHTGETDDGAAIPFFQQMPRYPLGSGIRYKTVKGIEHRFDKTTSPQSVSVQVGVSNSGESETLSAAKTIDIGSKGPYYTGHRVDGKFVSMRISGNATKPITYRGSFADVAERGER